MKLTPRQIDVFKCFAKDNPKILVCSGAKRSGKTYILTYIFLSHIAKYEDMGLSFIIGGSTQASIRRNILDDMEKILGKDLRLDKTNAVSIFGNKVYCFDGATSDAWKKARGFTSAGAYLNEGTALHDTFIKEVISRCSYKGARVLIDTNPENPIHTVKTDYIDKSGQKLDSGQLNIKAFHFCLDDNIFLDDEYKESIKKSTPSGMFYDRDVLGHWVSAEGVVYKDFDKSKHIINADQVPVNEICEYVAGVDWGYEHYGSIVVLGVTSNDTYYVLEQIAEQHKEIDYWVEQAKHIKEKYGPICFYCDSARPEHVKRFKREGIFARNADKAVISGIESVAKLIKTDKFYVLENHTKLIEEFYLYAWNSKTGDPIKQNDDVLDAVRYAVYSRSGKGGVMFG